MRVLEFLMVFVVLMSGLAGHSARASDDYFERIYAPKLLPEFSLVDQNGDHFGLNNLKDQWTLMFVGFTSCPHVCPVTLMKLEALRKEMGSRINADQIPRTIFLAVDPLRDQPALKEYLTHFDPEHTGITGVKVQIDTLVKGLEATYRLGSPLPGSDDYDVMHTSAIAVINPQGELVAKMNPPLDVKAMTGFLVNLIGSSKLAGTNRSMQ